MIDNLLEKIFNENEEKIVQAEGATPLTDAWMKAGNADFWKNIPLVLQVKDLSALLSASHNTAYQLVRSGQIRSIRVGRTYRIPRVALEEYLCRC